MATMSGSSQEPVDRGGLLGKRGTRRPEPTGAPRRSDRRPRAAGTRWVAGWRPGEGSKQGGQRRLRQPPTGRTAGPAPTLADRWRPKPTRSAVQPVGAARHSLVLLGFGRERATQRSGVARALETKFLRLDTRQEQDSVLSFPPSAGAGTGEWSGPQPAAVQAWALAATNSRRKARRSGQSTRQQEQRLCTDSSCVFSFFGEGCGDPLLLLPDRKSVV